MKKTQSFEEMLDELNSIVDKLSDEETPLEESLNLYAQAAEKIAACRSVLANAKIRVEEIEQTIVQGAEGKDHGDEKEV